jgi:Domain of unknown function (DUF929)
MSKTSKGSSPGGNQTSNRRTQALAELRRTQQRSQRRGRLLLAAGAVAAVLLIAVALVVAGLNREPSSSAPSGTASGAVVKDVTGVPAATYDEVGAGTSNNHPTRIDAPALTADGKPRVLYVGAEYCPYCAAQRWAIVAALSRFGTFTDLGQTTSSADDAYPNTSTLSFHGSSYTSDYLSFTGVETTSNKRQGNGYAPLDSLSAADKSLVDKYNAPPYVDEGGAIPFTDLGGKFVSSGASFDPQLLAGKTHAQIAGALADPSSNIAQGIDGTANAYTAALCELTGAKPANVCSSAGVQAAARTLGKK